MVAGLKPQTTWNPCLEACSGDWKFGIFALMLLKFFLIKFSKLSGLLLSVTGIGEIPASDQHFGLKILGPIPVE